MSAQYVHGQSMWGMETGSCPTLNRIKNNYILQKGRIYYAFSTSVCINH